MPTNETAGERLDAIMRDLGAAGDAWVKAGYPYEGPEFEARETVFLRLRKFNADLEYGGTA
jgi:hypothetical protein